MTSLVVIFAWVLCHDLSVYRAAELMPLAGPTYQVTSYDTKAECEAEQRAAMATEELPRVGPMTATRHSGTSAGLAGRARLGSDRTETAAAGRHEEMCDEVAHGVLQREAGDLGALRH